MKEPDRVCKIYRFTGQPAFPARAITTLSAAGSRNFNAARGEALGGDFAAIAGTSLDKGVELDAMAKTRKGPNPSYQTAARCSWRTKKPLPHKLMGLPLYRRPVE
jgi:hypothetical protein